MNWVRHHPEIEEAIFHIPNGGSRNLLEAAKLKKMGVKAGVSDLCLPIAAKGYHSLWIELKATNGRPTAPQRKWLAFLTKQGHKAEFAYGWDQARKIICDYLDMPY